MIRSANPAERFEPVAVLQVDLARPLEDIEGLHGHAAARVLVLGSGSPLGFVDVEVQDGRCSADALRAAVRTAGLDLPTSPPPRPYDGRWPRVTVAVCTRGRPKDLRECLTHLVRVEYDDLEVLVVDNAPADEANAEVCRAFATVRRIVEPRPGLDWARNRAVLEASGEILAFTDDDVRVESSWLRELVRPFLEDSRVMAVAGLGIPAELETWPQHIFEEYGGSSGGHQRIRMQGERDWGARGFWHYALMALQGSGANMAFRHAVFRDVGLFDPALDVGTKTNGGGDTEMLFRVLARGHSMVYEPRAIVRHRHRRDYRSVVHQISGWGSGMYAFLTRSALAFPRASWVLALLGLRGLLHLLARWFRPDGIPRRLIAAHLRGALLGPLRYVQARSAARAIHGRFGPQSPAAPR